MQFPIGARTAGAKAVAEPDSDNEIAGSLAVGVASCAPSVRARYPSTSLHRRRVVHHSKLGEPPSELGQTLPKRDVRATSVYPSNLRDEVAASRIPLTFLLVARRTFAPRNGDFRNGELAMDNDERRSSDERRSGKDRRSGIDTRSDQERRLIGERRSNNEQRSGLDRRSSNKANVSPMTGRRGAR